MVIESVRAFVEALRRYSLLEPEQFAELPSFQDRFPDARSLGKELIQRGWLTPYQVNQLALDRAGRLVLDQYVLLERLGEGGMGQVFKARHLRLGRINAIKVIRQEHLSNKHAVHRFKREAQAAAQLDHPHVVRVFDAGEDLGTHYLVMEFVEGKDLGRILKESGRLAIPLACIYARQAALGLAHAHERGLVHRDIKPGNIVITHPPGAKDGHVKILDMGLARLGPLQQQEGLASSMTREGTVIGTLDYMAPEQAKSSHDVDGRADLYSLGCTLYHLLTGRPPFVHGSGMEKLLKHQLDPVEPIRSSRPEIPEGLAAVVHKLLAKKPEDRYATAAEAARALEPFCDSKTLPDAASVKPTRAPHYDPLPPTAVVSSATPLPTLIRSPKSRTPSRPPRPRSRRNFWLATALLLVPVLVLIAAALAISTKPAPSSPASSTSSHATTTPRRDSPTTTREKPPEPPSVNWAAFTRFITDETVLVTTVHVDSLLHSPAGKKYILPGFQSALAGPTGLKGLFDLVKIDPERDLDRVTALSSAESPDHPLLVFQGRFKEAAFPTEDTPLFKVRIPPKGPERGIRLLETRVVNNGPSLFLAVIGTDLVLVAGDWKLLQDALTPRGNRGFPVRDLLRELTGQETIGLVGLGRALGKVETLEKIDPENSLRERTSIRGQVFVTDAFKTEIVFTNRQDKGLDKLKEVLDAGLRNTLLLAMPIQTTRSDLNVLKMVIRKGTFTVEGRSIVFRSLVTDQMLAP